jgi:hypothetical protein
MDGLGSGNGLGALSGRAAKKTGRIHTRGHCMWYVAKRKVDPFRLHKTWLIMSWQIYYTIVIVMQSPDENTRNKRAEDDDEVRSYQSL